jgi:hypothetical protein
LEDVTRCSEGAGMREEKMKAAVKVLLGNVHQQLRKHHYNENNNYPLLQPPEKTHNLLP